ncbi:hypothetical protein [Pseudomonas sp. Marseille-Q5115]|uniref:hypothetical protein n=1 Tax=Pseudomonas sp. Marseille-Q5115 TaxID=2866593 RepID=UPI001CE4A3CC|nr:hypothetical protein [Pseudomonas sp. Marseille-Q5115]
MNVRQIRAAFLMPLASLCCFMAQPIWAAAPLGSVTLLSATNTEHVLDDGEQWGRPMEYDLRANGAPIKPNEARALSFLNIPSSTRIFLSSDGNCARNSEVDFWIELAATREATYPPPSSQVKYMTLIELAAIGETESLGGLALVEKHIKISTGVDRVACVRITTSRRPGDVVPSVPLTFSDQDMDFPPRGDQTCPSPGVLRGRRGVVRPEGMLRQNICGASLSMRPSNAQSTSPLPWINTINECPINTVLTGTYNHSDGPNQVHLNCATLLDTEGRPLWIKPDDHFDIVGKYSDHDFSCPDGKVITGIRTGKLENENFDIGFRCATVLGYPSADGARSTADGPNADTGKITFIDDNVDANDKPYIYNFPDYGISRQFELRNYLSAFPFYSGDTGAGKHNINLFRLDNMAPATTVTLSSDPMCATTGDFHVTLKSVRANAGTPVISLEAAFKTEVGSMLENGLEMVSKSGSPLNKALRCVAVRVSRKPGQREPAPVPVVQGGWQWVIENDHEFACATGVLTGRGHQADETGQTQYACSTSPNLAKGPVQTYDGIRENSNTWFVCPFDQALIGRAHHGDETGVTTYRCATVTYNGRPVSIAPSDAWVPVAEDNHQFRCPPNEALIGRWHTGDTESGNGEQKNSAYRCGKLQY